MTDQQIASTDRIQVRAELKAPRAAGIAGLAFAVLFTAALIALRQQPLVGATDAEILDWFAAGNAGFVVVAGLYLAPFSGIAFLWFIAVIRDRVGSREDRFLGTVFLGSGLLFIALMFAAAAAAGSIVAGVQFQHARPPDAATVDLASSLAYVLLFVFAARAAAVFLISTATIGRRTGALPRAIVWPGYAVALVMLLTSTTFEWFILLLPGWVALASIYILASVDRGSAAA
jgi:hypothetical protein